MRNDTLGAPFLQLNTETLCITYIYQIMGNAQWNVHKKNQPSWKKFRESVSKQMSNVLNTLQLWRWKEGAWEQCKGTTVSHFSPAVFECLARDALHGEKSLSRALQCTVDWGCRVLRRSITLLFASSQNWTRYCNGLDTNWMNVALTHFDWGASTEQNLITWEIEQIRR